MGAVSFLRNTMGYFFSKRANPRSDQELIRKAANDPRFSDYGDPLVADRYCTSELADFLDLYATHPWVYVCASAIAQAAASVKFELKSKGKTLKPDEVGQFMVRPNPHMTWFELIETTFIHLELSGNSYWEIIRGIEGDGKVEAIFPMRPDLMKIVPHEKKKVERYEYQVEGKTINKLPPEHVLHLKYTSAKDEFYGTPPISAGQSEVTLDFWSTTWNKKFFKDGAEPGAVLETDQVLTDTTWNRVRALWNKRHRGVDKAHEVAILEGGLKFRQVTSKHADMQYGEQKKLSRDVVLAIMRVPPVIVGLVDGITYANSKDQKKVFWQHNIIPKLQRIQDAINAFLMPEGIEFNFVTKMIDSIVEDDQVKAQIAQANVQSGIMTINEVREKYYNLPPQKWGDVWWAPVGVAPVDGPQAPVMPGQEHQLGEGVDDPMSAGLKSPTQVPALGRPTRERPAETAQATQTDTEKRELEDIHKAAPNWDNPLEVLDYQAFEIWKAQAGPDDRQLRGLMQDWFREQGERVLSKVERRWPSIPVKKAEGDGEGGAGFLNVEDILADLLEDEGRLEAILRPEANRVMRKYGATMLAELQVPKRFELDAPHVKAFLEKYAAARVRQINEVTRDLLRRKLVEAWNERAGVKEVMAKIRDVFQGNISAFRARRIARTEIVTLTNSAKFEAAVQSGVVKKKRWVSELLSSTRKELGGANHVALHGKVIDLDKKFEAPNRRGGVDLLDCPGDLAASAENACGCLCIAVYSAGSGVFDHIILGDEPAPVQKAAELAPPPAPPQVVEHHHHTHIHQAAQPPSVVNVENKIGVQPPNVQNQIDVHPAPVVNKVDVHPTPVTVENNLEVNPTPVTVENQVDVQPAPVNPTPVTIENQVDVQPAPVTVEKTAALPPQTIVVQAPAVTINPEVKVEVKQLPHSEEFKIFRDEKGQMTGGKKTIKDIEE